MTPENASPWDRKEAHYDTRRTRIYTHLDWYLRLSLSEEASQNRWTLAEVQDRMYSATGIRLRQSTILKRNAGLFDIYQCSPLRRLDIDHYSLDPVYYAVAGNRVRPPQIGRGRPREKDPLADLEAGESL